MIEDVKDPAFWRDLRKYIHDVWAPAIAADPTEYDYWRKGPGKKAVELERGQAQL